MGGWNDWEPVMLSYIGQFDRNLINTPKKLSSVGKFCYEREFVRRPRARQLLNLHFLLMVTIKGAALDIVGNAGGPGGLETACLGPATEIEGSWSDAEAARARIHQRHRILRAV